MLGTMYNVHWITSDAPKTCLDRWTDQDKIELDWLLYSDHILRSMQIKMKRI